MPDFLVSYLELLGVVYRIFLLVYWKLLECVYRPPVVLLINLPKNSSINLFALCMLCCNSLNIYLIYFCGNILCCTSVCMFRRKWIMWSTSEGNCPSFLVSQISLALHRGRWILVHVVPINFSEVNDHCLGLRRELSRTKSIQLQLKSRCNNISKIFLYSAKKEMLKCITSQIVYQFIMY